MNKIVKNTFCSFLTSVFTLALLLPVANAQIAL